MKRAYVFKSLQDKHGKLMVVEKTMEDFITKISSRFQLNTEEVCLTAENGCEIDDVSVIRDDEKIYIFCKDKQESEINDLSTQLFENEKKVNDKSQNQVSEWITLNVGGKHFTTSRHTLIAKEPSSMLSRMFASDNNVYLMNPSDKDETGAYLIDRSPEYFEPILNYLRHNEVILDKHVNPKGVLEEALYYGIDTMVPQLKQIVEKSENKQGNNEALTRMDVVKSIIVTPVSFELRFQGVNLSGADLSRLNLKNINFKYACLSHCNLSGANLSHCCLERADLSHSILEGAQLLGVKALCANMEGANLKGCYMEDPNGSKAVLEGVNLKNANMEGSYMTGVNLRVATLKHANLQNCNLRRAVLAGADLECCDLSGSDLHEANLRGANLKDAAFELMLTPLHMSQTIR